MTLECEMERTISGAEIIINVTEMKLVRQHKNAYKRNALTEMLAAHFIFEPLPDEYHYLPA